MRRYAFFRAHITSYNIYYVNQCITKGRSTTTMGGPLWSNYCHRCRCRNRDSSMYRSTLRRHRIQYNEATAEQTHYCAYLLIYAAGNNELEPQIWSSVAVVRACPC